MRNLLLLLGISILLSACGSTRNMSYPPGDSYGIMGSFAENSRYEKKGITESLFKSDKSTISEADIQRLLDGEIRLPDTVRVALLNFGSNSTRRYYANYWMNEDYLKLKQSYLDIIEEKLSRSGRVGKTMVVPKLILSHNPDIVQLREAAVRLQADVILIFTVKSDIYYKYKMFKKSEAKAFATCEALLMDIRTGVIPFSEVVTSDMLVSKEDSDLTEEEMRMRAENEATQKTLNEVADKLVQFFRDL